MNAAFFILALLFAGVTAAAAELAPSCPQSISVTQHAAGQMDAWESMNARASQAHRLRTASLYNGHPKELTQLREADDDGPGSPGKPRVLTFKFPARYPNGIWLACSYEDTSVIVFTRLPEVPASCQITYTQMLPPAPVLTVRCN